MTIKGRTVGFVGGGNMGEALIKGLIAASLVPAKDIRATDVRASRSSTASTASRSRPTTPRWSVRPTS
jgi:pyrroline-5-carboxylate reductase